jgi:hypothetical protein
MFITFDHPSTSLGSRSDHLVAMGKRSMFVDSNKPFNHWPYNIWGVPKLWLPHNHHQSSIVSSKQTIQLLGCPHDYGNPHVHHRPCSAIKITKVAADGWLFDATATAAPGLWLLTGFNMFLPFQSTEPIDFLAHEIYVFTVTVRDTEACFFGLLKTTENPTVVSVIPKIFWESLNTSTAPCFCYCAQEWTWDHRNSLDNIGHTRP